MYNKTKAEDGIRIALTCFADSDAASFYFNRTSRSFEALTGVPHDEPED